MANLFDKSDFALFTQYANKTQAQEPTGQAKLRTLYDKLGKVLDGLRSLGYHTDIIRMPLMQAGPATMKYAEYHWSRVYPKDDNYYKECKDKVFVVVGTASDGVNFHIDSYSSKGYKCNKVSQRIKDQTWLQISPDEASAYSCGDLVNKADEYIKNHWMEFNQFAKEFGIQESVKILNKMEIDKIKQLLLGNYNIILTGAPGTGKTYLAKQIAKAMGATEDIGACKMVQFHPSYDYTDFVEGLRPIKEGDKLGFQRKDGVFKDFCRTALNDSNNTANKQAVSIDVTFRELWERIRIGDIKTLKLFDGGDSLPMIIKTDNENMIYFSKKESPKEISIGNEVSLDKVKKAFDEYQITSVAKLKEAGPDRKKLGSGGNVSNLWAVINYLLEHREELVTSGSSISKKYVFIIDEINRGEISKIFGELFYAIDAGYRGIKGRVETQYQSLVPEDDVFSKGFYIPQNVYIIGTMNDIDRSVESMDFAMRRRFAWKEITAKSRQSMLDEDEAWGTEGKPSEEVIAEMKVRMDNLNSAIIDQYGDEELSNKDKIGLSKAYQIGASYFLKYSLYNNFEELWTNHLKGLLYEYLRGKTNVDEKINRLYQAYNDTTTH